MINYLLNGKATIILLTVGLIKTILYIDMSYFPRYSYNQDKIEVKLDLSNNSDFTLKNCLFGDVCYVS